MLVITTQEGEAIQIGEDVRILVRRVKGGWVRLCIDAPREIPIQRIEAPSADVEVAKRPKRVGEGT
jgi:carbon storage regulator